jgi:drug/metabolite transporter (DMT)-like permease
VRRRISLTPFDGLLFLMILIWGGHYTIVKVAFTAMPYVAFNATRLVIASILFLAVIAWQGFPRLTRRDWVQLVLLGAVGHCLYQWLFMGGLVRTTVGNSSLISGCSPVAVALASAWAGHERISRAQGVGVALSAIGIYVIVGRSAEFGGAHLVGDLLTVVAVLCWSVYTVGSRALLTRFSPIVVTGLTLVAGTALYLPGAARDLVSTPWATLGVGVWAAMLYSSVLSLNVAYLIWYTSVQRIGNMRTSAWSNLIPVVALSTAAVYLREPVNRVQLIGATAILAGVALTRLVSRGQTDAPAEE